MTKPLRVLSIGAGAIGTYIGGSLALHGHHVVFLERPAVAEELTQRGLRLKIGDQEHRLPAPKVVGSFDELLRLQAFDVALFALKSYDTPSFIAGLPPDRNSIPSFLCLSNGVENEAALAAALGAEKVIAGTVTSAVGRFAAGDIELERLRGVGIAAGHPLSQRLVEAMASAGLNARLFPDARAMKWSKMLTNLIANATSAILNMTPAEIFAHPGLYRLEMSQLREALDVMQAQGIGVVDLPGTPVRLLAFAVRSLPLALSRPLLARAVGGGRGGKMPSFHIDLYSGSGKSEVDYLNGAVVRAGVATGTPTPVNRFLNQTLLALTRGELPIDEYAGKPDLFLQRSPL